MTLRPNMTRWQIQDAISEIDNRPLSREERDRLIAPLLKLLELDCMVERVRRYGFGAP